MAKQKPRRAKGRASNPSQSPRKRRSIEPRPAAPAPVRRTIGQILDDEPRTADEVVRHSNYMALLKAFYATSFRGSLRHQVDYSECVKGALRELRLTRSDLRHALLTNAVGTLRRIAETAKRILQELDGKPADLSSAKPSGTARPTGYGGYPQDCCQECGLLLTEWCYSQILNENRVPRTDKICAKCYGLLPDSEKEAYHFYRYGHRPEPSGTGWNPQGSHGKGHR